MKSFLLVMLVVALTSVAQAETRYVGDQLEITMRSGKSTRNAIVRMLRSGTAVELLETDPETGYSRVRTASGADGWVLTRFLIAQPVARDQLAAAREQLARATGEKQSLQEQLGELRATHRDGEAARAQLEASHQELTRELEEIRRLAADVIAIEAENKRLVSRLVTVEQERDELLDENSSLSDRTAREWMVRGAGVVLLGVLLGLILPRIPRRRKSTW